MTDKARQYVKVDRQHTRSLRKTTRLEREKDGLWFELSRDEKAWVLAGGEDAGDEDPTNPGWLMPPQVAVP